MRLPIWDIVDGQNHIGIDSKNWMWSECFTFQMMIGFVWNQDMFCHDSYCTRTGKNVNPIEPLINSFKFSKQIKLRGFSEASRTVIL